MRIDRVFRFFLKEIKLKIWFRVIINFILQFSVILAEILFLSIFFLVLNKETSSKIFKIFAEKVEIYIVPLFEKFSINEIYILLLILFLIIKNILSVSHNFYYSKFIFNLSAEKSSEILKSYMNKSYDIFSKNEISIYLKQLVKDVEGVFVGIFGLIISFIGELLYVLILVFFISYLVSFSPSLEVYFIFILIFAVLFILFLAAKKYGEVRAYNEVKVFKTLSDTLNMFKEIKLLDDTKSFVKRYRIFLDNYYKSRVAAGVINLTPKITFEIFLLILFYVIYKNESNLLTIDEFVIKYSVFALALLRLIPSFSRLSTFFSMILFNLESIKFIEKDLKKKNSVKIKKIKKKIKIQSIQLQGVKINYLSNAVTKFSDKFNNLNLDLKINNIYGIYGESGSGKTSLLNLLSGFIKPNKGKILINENQYNFYDLTKKFNIGYSPQMTTILDENILINTTLKYSNSAETINELKNFLYLFNLKKFVKKKYFENTSISSIKNMSGGEKQRIGFIRSIINEPDLILLDEPTSSLDKKNEQAIFEYLLSIKKNKIIVITSHKKENKKYFNKIINL